MDDNQQSEQFKPMKSVSGPNPKIWTCILNVDPLSSLFHQPLNFSNIGRNLSKVIATYWSKSKKSMTDENFEYILSCWGRRVLNGVFQEFILEFELEICLNQSRTIAIMTITTRRLLHQYYCIMPKIIFYILCNERKDVLHVRWPVKVWW